MFGLDPGFVGGMAAGFFGAAFDAVAGFATAVDAADAAGAVGVADAAGLTGAAGRCGSWCAT